MVKPKVRGLHMEIQPVRGGPKLLDIYDGLSYCLKIIQSAECRAGGAPARNGTMARAGATSPIVERREAPQRRSAAKQKGSGPSATPSATGKEPLKSRIEDGEP